MAIEPTSKDVPISKPKESSVEEIKPDVVKVSNPPTGNALVQPVVSEICDPENVKPEGIVPSPGKQSKNETSSFFEDALQQPKHQAKPNVQSVAPPTAPPPILKPSKSDEAPLSANRTYARDILIELKQSTTAMPFKIPAELAKKSTGYSTNPFDTGHQQNWSHSQQRQPSQHSVPPTRRMVQRTPEEEICRQVRSILNKLTPDNFDGMTFRMYDLLKDDKLEWTPKVQDKFKLFSEVVGIIFDKAISEPTLVETYAKMCTYLNKIEFIDQDNKKVNFKKVMLNFCQREFEDHDHGNARQIELEKALEEAKTPQEKKSAEEDLLEYKFIMKKKYLGNIRLISELYKTKELTMTIIIDCISRLVKERDEETLECLCKLLRTIGCMFEEAIMKQKGQLQAWWKQVIQTLNDIVTERQSSSRIRFFIADVLEARKDGWTFKKTQDGPKKIAELRSDFEREHAEKEKEASKYRGAMSAQRSGGRNNQQRGMPHVASSGQLSRQGSDRGHDSGDTRSFACHIPQTSNDSSQSVGLRPKWSGAWSKGATASASSASGDDQRSRTPGMAPGVLGSSAASGYRGSRSVEKNRDSAGVSPINKRAEPAMSRSATGPLGARGQGRASDVGVTNIEPLTDDQISNLAQRLIGSYLREVERSPQEFQDKAANALASPNSSVFIKNAIQSGLEKAGSEASEIGKLFAFLYAEGKVNRKALIDGLINMADEGDDMEVDLPKFWTLFSQLLYHLLLNDKQQVVDHEIFNAILKGIQNDLIDKLCQRFLEVYIANRNQDEVAKFAGKAGLCELVSEDFLKQHQHLLGDVPNSSTYAELENIVKSTFTQANGSPVENQNDQVVDKIMNSFSEEDRKSPHFIHCLTKDICSTCLTGSKNGSKLSAEHLNIRVDVLKRFCAIENKKHGQAVLSGAHELVVNLDRPPNLLQQFFSTVSENDIFFNQFVYF